MLPHRRRPTIVSTVLAAFGRLESNQRDYTRHSLESGQGQGLSDLLCVCLFYVKFKVSPGIAVL